MKLLKSTGLILLFLFFTAIAHAEQKLVVYTVNYPLQYFAQQIGGDEVEVHFPAPADVDPAFWMPDSETLSGYQGADVILLNGAGYARWLNKASLPRLKMVNTSEGFMDYYITTDLDARHSHGPGGEHSHAGMAFTTWLDFKQALIQAHAVLKILKQKRPELSDRFDQNYNVLEKQLMDLDRRMRALSLKKPGVILWTSHPVYQYMARRYQMNLQSVMWEPDKALSKQALDELKKGLKEYPSQWMLWEAEPLEESVQALGKLELQSLVFNPSANVPRQGDFLSVMQGNVENLEVAFQ
jgi:zinc transport system substrate-binding protein